MRISRLLQQARYQILRNTILLPSTWRQPQSCCTLIHTDHKNAIPVKLVAFFITLQPRTFDPPFFFFFTQPEVTFSFSTNHFLQITLEVQLIFSVGLNLVENVKQRKASIIQMETKRGYLQWREIKCKGKTISDSQHLYSIYMMIRRSRLFPHPAFEEVASFKAVSTVLSLRYHSDDHFRLLASKYHKQTRRNSSSFLFLWRQKTKQVRFISQTPEVQETSTCSFRESG